MKIKKILTVITLLLALFLMVGCTNKPVESTSKEDTQVQDEKNNEDNKVEEPEVLPKAIIKIKDFGTLEAELYPHIAPITVKNFTKLANEGFYDGLTFHRIIKDFMIQGGDPEGNGRGGPGHSIKGEFSKNGVENNIKHVDGVLSMARSQHPDSAGSQFFIMTGEAQSLDGNYAAFGKVIKNIELLDQLESVKVKGETPVEKPVIEEIRVAVEK